MRRAASSYAEGGAPAGPRRPDSGFGRASAGATVDALARLSPVPVLAVKTRPNRPYRNLIVATDFSEPSRDALSTALEMFPSANIVLFHAYHIVYESLIDDKCAAREAEARHAEGTLDRVVFSTDEQHHRSLRAPERNYSSVVSISEMSCCWHLLDGLLSMASAKS